MKQILILSILLHSWIYAVVMSPLTQTVDSRKKIHMTFMVGNPSKEPVAVDFSVLRLIDTNNNKEQREATTNVQVYPSQFVLKGKENKKIRVRYMGKQLPDIEEVYRVIAKELDIDVTDKSVDAPEGKIKAEIKMRFTYEGLLFVKKPSSHPNLAVESIEILENRVVKIVIKNSGESSAVPNGKNYNFIATVNNKPYLLTEDDLKGAEFRRVLAGKNNTFILKNISNLPQGTISSIDLERKIK
jgi:P pilus assembly chaperone PapD